MVIGPGARPPAVAIVMFATAVPVVVVAPGEAAAGAVAFPDCAGSVTDDAPAEPEAAADAGASEDRDVADADSAEADKDGLAEQPATARAARTAQAGATFTLNRRAAPSAGAHGYRADVGQRPSRDEDRLRVRRPYGFFAIPQ
jgi:hypothetical protein